MANGMWDFKGWHIMTDKEIEQDRLEMRQLTEEFDRRWPPSQRRNRCMVCGSFMQKRWSSTTKCKRCGESWASQQ